MTPVLVSSSRTNLSHALKGLDLLGIPSLAIGFLSRDRSRPLVSFGWAVGCLADTSYVLITMAERTTEGMALAAVESPRKAIAMTTVPAECQS